MRHLLELHTTQSNVKCDHKMSESTVIPVRKVVLCAVCCMLFLSFPVNEQNVSRMMDRPRAPFSRSFVSDHLLHSFGHAAKSAKFGKNARQ